MARVGLSLQEEDTIIVLSYFCQAEKITPYVVSWKMRLTYTIHSPLKQAYPCKYVLLYTE